MAKAKQNTFAAIDVGTSKICTVIANAGEGDALRVIGVGVAPSRGLQKGAIIDIDAAKEAIKESITESERVSGLRLESAYVGVSGKHIQSLNNRGVVAISRTDQKVASSDLERVLESARNVTMPSDRSLLHVIPKTFSLDGQVGIKEPVGMHGFRLDVETHIVTAATASVQNLIKSVRGAGVEIEDLILSSLSSSEAVLTPEEKEDGIIIADIGAGTTDVAIFRNGSVWHTTVIPVGGNQITRDISIGLGVPIEVAEQMKKKYGKATPVNGAGDSFQDEKGNGHSVATKDLCEIIRARLEELLRLVIIELPQSDYNAVVPAGLVLTGGTANLPGIDKLGQELFRLPVRIGVPSNMYGLTDNLYNPMYSTSIGLMMWGAMHESGEGLPPASMKNTVHDAVVRPLLHAKRLFKR